MPIFLTKDGTLVTGEVNETSTITNLTAGFTSSNIYNMKNCTYTQLYDSTNVTISVTNTDPYVFFNDSLSAGTYYINGSMINGAQPTNVLYVWVTNTSGKNTITGINDPFVIKSDTKNWHIEFEHMPVGTSFDLHLVISSTSYSTVSKSFNMIDSGTSISVNANEIVEYTPDDNGKMSVSKFGDIKVSDIVELEAISYDGKIWFKIFEAQDPQANLFTSADRVTAKTEPIIGTNKYCMLYLLNHLKSPNNNYEFLVKWTNSSSGSEINTLFTQTDNPFSITSNDNSGANKFIYAQTQAILTLNNGWWGAIGPNIAYAQGGTPGFQLFNNSNASLIKSGGYEKLYLRVK